MYPRSSLVDSANIRPSPHYPPPPSFLAPVGIRQQPMPMMNMGMAQGQGQGQLGGGHTMMGGQLGGPMGGHMMLQVGNLHHPLLCFPFLPPFPFRPPPLSFSSPYIFPFPWGSYICHRVRWLTPFSQSPIAVHP